MSEKMPAEWERKFVIELYNLQLAHNAFWVQTKHIASALFGASLSDKEEQTKKMRVHRLALRLKGKILLTERRIQVGKSTGRSLVKYYHVDPQHVPFLDRRNLFGVLGGNKNG